MIFSPKINNIPQFYMILPEKCPNFTYKLPDFFTPNFSGGEGAHAPPSAPISYGYGETEVLT